MANHSDSPSFLLREHAIGDGKIRSDGGSRGEKGATIHPAMRIESGSDSITERDSGLTPDSRYDWRSSL
jgi:hypothetical protein